MIIMSNGFSGSVFDNYGDYYFIGDSKGNTVHNGDGVLLTQ